MKPRFAIRFADDGLALLHRDRRGWVEVGDTAFDTPDLDEALAWLRASALGLSPEGIETWLVLPNSQILYTDVTVDGGNDAAHRATIAAALEGRTPYDVADLVYDFILTGQVAQVAVVARETLEEAEGFAVQHGLNPVGFTAVPGAGVFDAAPFFGMTAAAAMLFPGKAVRREARPVVVAPPKSDPAPPAAAPVPEMIAPAVATAADTPPPVDAPSHVDVPSPEPAVETPAVTAFDPIPVPVPVPVAAFVDAEPSPAPEPSPAAQAPVLQAPVLQAQDVLAFDPIPAPPSPEPASPAPVVEVEEAPIALDVPDEYEPPRFTLRAGDGLAVTSPETAAEEDEPTTPVPSSIAASLSFASRRTVEASISRVDAAKTARSVGAATRGQPGLTAPTDSAAPPPPPAVAPPPPAKPDVARPKISAPPVPERRSTVRVTAKQSPAGAAAAGKPTEFNPKARPPVPGKPRYLGLILTGVLLLFLAVAAALSNYLIAGLGWDDPAPEVQTATSDSTPATAPDATATTATATTATTATATATTATEAPATETAATDTTAAAPDAAPTDPAAAAPAVTASGEPAPSVAGTPATVAAAPPLAEEIILSSADQAPSASDAGALPDPQAQGDPPPAGVAAPPPFGTVYQFDDKGLIVPTPEGILTPEGVLLVAGPPPLKPPARPEGLVPEGLVPQTVAATAAAPVVAEPFLADPALAGARPRARPADLSPPPTNSGALIPASAAATDVLAAAPNTGLRPAARPQSVLDAGVQAQEAQLAAASLASGALADPNRSVLAIAVSRRPAPRPADMARAVEAAVAAAARQPEPAPQPEPEPEPQQAANPDIAPEMLAEAEVDEPEAAMPAVPTRASVAKQATVANVLSLSKLSLIGIYGTPSNRHAMVRQANGRYVKVSIGDRIDGGRVAAITESELRYQKGGRMLVLEMPQG
ncbi:MAG: hypothetical protein CFE34_03760 [Rhodobacteraceae bacterium PARR1]|nr:MAG: hypothetical protein CFE34_03760 [Rhodobacteraceae bacterium PARR1]